MKRMRVNNVGFEVEVDDNGGGTLIQGINDTFGIDPDDVDDYGRGCIDALESLLLSLACEGVDISTPAFEVAVQTSLDAIGNQP